MGGNRGANPGAGGVAPAGTEGAGRAARHRTDLREPELVEGGGAGNLNCFMPDTVHLADGKRLLTPRAVGVPPAGPAVTRGAARRGGKPRSEARVLGGEAGYFNNTRPDTVTCTYVLT